MPEQRPTLFKGMQQDPAFDSAKFSVLSSQSLPGMDRRIGVIIGEKLTSKNRPRNDRDDGSTRKTLKHYY